MQLKGKIIKILEMQTGEGQKGQWSKQEFVIETDGQYPQKVCFECWNTTIENLVKFKEGDTITVHFEPRSKEYNDRWYTTLNAWKLE